MARKTLDPSAPSFADMLSAPIPAPDRRSNMPKPLPAQRNGEQEQARSSASPAPIMQPEPPPQVASGHDSLDDARRAQSDPARKQQLRAAGKKADAPARSEKARKYRAARRQKALAQQKERAKTNPLLTKNSSGIDAQMLRDQVRTTAQVLYRTGLATTEQIAAQCGVQEATIRQWVHRYNWRRDPGVEAPVRTPKENVPRGTMLDGSNNGCAVAGHRFELKGAKQAAKDARAQAMIEHAVTVQQRAEAKSEDSEGQEGASQEAEEPEGRVSLSEVVDFQGRDDVDCKCLSLLTFDESTNGDAMMGCGIEKGLQGGSVEHKKFLSPIESAPCGVTPPLVAAVLATREEGDKARWQRRRDDWRERSHNVFSRALGAAESLPDVLLLDKDTTQSLKHVQEMARKNLDLDTEQGKGGGGNLLVQILAAPVGVAVQIERTI